MLILEYCSHLVRIDPSIGQLQRLQILDLKFCTDLSNLPRELDSLEALRELRLDGTCIEDIPVSEDMKHLKAKLKKLSEKLTKDQTKAKVKFVLKLKLWMSFNLQGS